MNYGLYKSRKERVECIRKELVDAYDPLRPLHRDCADFILPNRYEENVATSGLWTPRASQIIDGTATHSISVHQAGMMSTLCSSQRPWFRLMPPDKDLAERGRVKEWLQGVQDDMYYALGRSNFYNRTAVSFGNNCAFGLAAQSIEESMETGIRCMTFNVGSFRIGVDANGVPSIFQRDYPMTVRQMVERFGKYDPKTGRARWELFTERIKTDWDNSNYGKVYEIRHLIEPNLEYNPSRIAAKFAKFSSVYWEAGDGIGDRFLEDSGYGYFPILANRWEVNDEKPYAMDFPGARIVGDTMQLQKGEELGMQAQEMMIRPPMKAHTSLQGKTSQIPGTVTFTDSKEFFESAVKVDYNLQYHELKQAAIRNRIDEFTYAKLFTRLLSDTRAQRATAAEIVQTNQEIFTILSPQGGQIAKDHQDPTISITFMMLVRQGLLERRPPPPELKGMPLQVQYMNMMAQAQKMMGSNVQERFLSYAGNVIKMNPSSAQKIDFDQAIDEYADSLGVNPRIVVPDEKVAEVRAAMAKAQQQQQTMEAINIGSQSMKNLSQANLSTENVLSSLVNPAAAGGP